MRRLFLAVLLSIVTLVSFPSTAGGARPVIDLPLDPDIDVRLTAGFHDPGHHVRKLKSEYAVDIGVDQDTSIIAPFDGSIIYQRFANGAFDVTGVPIGGRIPGCSAVTLIRDDDINSANGLWTVSLKSASNNVVITILHLSQQTLIPSSETPPTGPLRWKSAEFPVNAGQAIAKTGGALNTPGGGCSTAAHVHLEVTDTGLLGAFQGTAPFEINVRVGCPLNCAPRTLTVADLTQGTLFGDTFRAPIISPPPPPPAAGALDVFLLVDLSGSFWDDLPVFKTQAPDIISSLRASNPDSRFGLAKFEDYPIPPFGSAAAGDKAYERLVDLTFDTDVVLDTISALFTRFGDDAPQSQLPALYQAATGAGQDLSGVGFPGASIPPGQQANFRDGVTKLFLLWTDAPFHQPGDPGAIPYPGPSFSETVDAILALDPPKVIGISSGPFGVPDLQQIAEATGAVAPTDGVDCDGDGAIDIAEGEPLVCSIATSGEGIGEAITALVEAASVMRVDIDIKPGSDPNSIDPSSAGVIPLGILSTPDFDAPSEVDKTSLTFGVTGDEPSLAFCPSSADDVNGDGLLDQVCHFETRLTGFQVGDTEGVLRGQTVDGVPIEGRDAVRIVPP